MMALLFTIAAVVLVIDQFTKVLAVSLLEYQPPVPVIGSLAGFTFYRNPGAALGLGSSVTWIAVEGESGQRSDHRHRRLVFEETDGEEFGELIDHDHDCRECEQQGHHGGTGSFHP